MICEYRSRRVVAFPGFAGVAEGNYRGHQTTLMVTGGYRFALGAGWQGRAIGKLSQHDVSTRGYAESGAGIANLAVAGQQATVQAYAKQLAEREETLRKLRADKGDADFPSQWRVAHVAQETPALERAAVDYAIDGDTTLRRLERERAAIQREIDRLQQQGADGPPGALERLLVAKYDLVKQLEALT